MYLVGELVDSKVVGLLALLVLVVVLSDVVEVVDEDLPSLELYLSRLVLSHVRCLENITTVTVNYTHTLMCRIHKSVHRLTLAIKRNSQYLDTSRWVVFLNTFMIVWGKQIGK